LSSITGTPYGVWERSQTNGGPVARDGGTPVRSSRRAAVVAAVSFARSKALVEGLGPTASQRLYLTAATDGVTDNTHFSAHGAGEMANLVVQEVRGRNLTVLTFLR
jgi:hypothetical protein